MEALIIWVLGFAFATNLAIIFAVKQRLDTIQKRLRIVRHQLEDADLDDEVSK